MRLHGLEIRSPVRVVLDSSLRLPPTAKLVEGAASVPLWVIAAEDAPVAAEERLVAAGAEVMRVSRAASGHLDLGEALRLLATRGITRIFSEGGPTVGEQLALQGFADEVVVSTSPNPLGGEGIVAVRPGLAALLADPEIYARAEAGQIGCDRFEHFTRIA